MQGRWLALLGQHDDTHFALVSIGDSGVGNSIVGSMFHWRREDESRIGDGFCKIIFVRGMDLWLEQCVNNVGCVSVYSELRYYCSYYFVLLIKADLGKIPGVRFSRCISRFPMRLSVHHTQSMDESSWYQLMERERLKYDSVSWKWKSITL